MVLTEAHHALIANARRAFAEDLEYVIEIAREAADHTPVQAPKAPRVPLTAEEKRLRRNERMRARRARLTPEQKAKEAAYLRDWKARAKGVVS